MLDTKHPCYNPKSGVSHGRVHLPVAKGCNIQCNYCNRLYDCVNESRPGVTSAVLSPRQALYYLDNVIPMLDCEISVVGIAGPGDPFNEPENTIDTLRLVKEKYPAMLTCIASNGLNLAEYAPILASIGVGHVTVTINAVDHAITAKMISWAKFRSKIYRGLEAGTLLLERQLLAVKALKDNGITVKINSIVVPGINDTHITDVSKKMKELGADVMNILPLRPVEHTPFGAIAQPDHELMQKVRWEASQNMEVVRHCAMCRADAAGRLGQNNPEAVHNLLQSIASMPLNPLEHRPYVAVASREGMLVNEHLGQANLLYVYNIEDVSFPVVEIRNAPAAGTGINRWTEMADILHDCKALIVNQAGEPPKAALAEEGIKVIVTEGLIEQALMSIKNGMEPLPVVNIKSCTGGGCGKGCG